MNAFTNEMKAPIGNVEAELAVVGALLCENRLIDRIADRLTSDDFADKFIGYVYALILREYAAGRPVNPITLKPLLADEPAFAELGGIGWLAELTSGKINTVAAAECADQIASLAARRRLVEGLREAIDQAGDLNENVETLIETADDAITAARDQGEEGFEYSAADALDKVIAGFNEPVTGVTCGNIPSIDKLLGPMRPSHLIIGGGRPGMGKTACAVSYALGAAERGHGVLFVSLEMGAEQLAERMAADLCFEGARIPYADIRDRRLNSEQQREICRARNRLAEMPLQIIDKGGINVSRLRLMVKRWKRRFAARGTPLELVVVDYLQLLRADKGLGQYEAVTEISKTLKEIAKDNDLAVFALAQLSRKVEQRGDKRPQLDDFRDSGQIEQDADAVLFFLRDEYYLRKEGQPEEHEPEYADWRRRLDKCVGRIEFICAKRRNGQEGALIGNFFGPYQAVRG